MNAVMGRQCIAGGWAMVKSTDGLPLPSLLRSQPFALAMTTGCYRLDISHQEHHVRYRKVER